MEPLSWTSDVTEQRVRERTFSLKVGDEDVPGIAWSPEGKDRWPTILLGHGGTQDKRTPGVLSLARRLARHLGYGSVAIDAPEHGERRSGPHERIGPRQMRERVASMTEDQRAEMSARNEMAVAEWRAVLDALQATPGFSDGPFGYWGVSMGTAIGLPLVAADDRITAAVFGLAGLGSRWDGERFAERARALRVPVLFLYQWDDELMERAQGLALFDAIGSREKTMHVNPGGHIEMPPHERDAVEAFFRRHIGANQ